MVPDSGKLHDALWCRLEMQEFSKGSLIVEPARGTAIHFRLKQCFWPPVNKGDCRVGGEVGGGGCRPCKL